jgi:hypothetical protein
MKVEVLYVPGCPNHHPAMQRVQQVLASESLQAELCEISVSSAVQATDLRFPGSPTIRIDGEDVEPGEARTFALSCRLYPNQSGIPSEETVRAAMLRAQRKNRL